jgi:hypothetical protein
VSVLKRAPIAEAFRLSNSSFEAMAEKEDPLIAALPPATDYITYVMLLEYQLNPGNLDTLNNLLSADDGKLAEEIGWDLIRLVLPMLNKVPEAVTECLDLIARRGNPREVVIRVAEELDKLGRMPEEDTEVSDSDEESKGDGLPTFAGEAKRVHLGDMKLDGMPEDKQSLSMPASSVLQELNAQSSKISGGKYTDLRSRLDRQGAEQFSFSLLMLMLSTVHPRIKTQYPSRFLATSLPAALGAYRRLDATIDSVFDWHYLLSTLQAAQKPPLPPRDPNDTNAVSNAPKPDPEAASEETGGTGVVVPANEKAIVTRLLNAVLLEVLDEYQSSLNVEDEPTMALTLRLREDAHPQKIIPGKKTQSEIWQSDEILKERWNTLMMLASLAWQFKLDALAVLKENAQPGSASAEAAVEPDEEPSEYPTSPSQIPFAQTALVLLAAAQIFDYQNRREELKLDAETVWTLFSAFSPLSEAPKLPSPPIQDSLHALLFKALASSQTFFQVSSKLESMVYILVQTFTINPHPQIRDDAHYLAASLLRLSAELTTKLRVIKRVIEGHTEVDGAQIPLATPLTAGSLKAVGVDWLKQEFLFGDHAKSTPMNVKAEQICYILKEDAELMNMLFPTVPEVSEDSASNDDDQEHLLLDIPFYVSVMNLCCIILSSKATNTEVVQCKATVMLGALKGWSSYLIKQFDIDEEVRQRSAEIYALEDACQRLSSIISSS